MSTAETVFVVDDENEVRGALTELISTAGLSAVGFHSAHEFLATFDRRDSGCLLVDLRMPGMDGLQLQEELIKRGCALPVVFLTAYGTVGSAVRAMKAGAVDFLEKPVNGQRLLESLRRAL